MLRIAVDARYISVGNEGNGFYTYLANLLIGLQNQYTLERNSTGKEPYYHFYLLSMEEIDLENLGLSSKHFTRQLLPLPENISSTRKKSYYLNLFQQTVLSMEPKINIVFFPHLEFPRKFRQWSKHKIKVVLTIHDLIPTYFISPKVLLSGKIRINTLTTTGIEHYVTVKLNHKHWDKILTVSTTSEQQILSVTGAKQQPKITVTPLGADKIFKPYLKQTFDEWLPRLLAKQFYPTKDTSTASYQDIAARNNPSLGKTRIEHHNGTESGEHHTNCDDSENTTPFQYKRYLLYFGGYTIRKNVALGIRGCTEVLATLPALNHFKIVMVGYGKWTRVLVRKGLHKNIIFLNHLSKQELAILISGAQFTLQPPLIEGFGLPVLESIRSYTLPICSDLPTNVDILGKDYPRFNPYRLKDIKRVVRYFLTLSPSEVIALRNKALIHARPFSWEQTATLTHEVFQTFSNPKSH